MADPVFAAPWRNAWLGPLACVALAGCANPAANPGPPGVAAEAGYALVIGWGSSTIEKARAALVTTQGTRVSSLYVAKASEQKSGLGGNIARLAPGDYALTIACELYVDYRIFPQETVIQAALRAGRVYRLRPEPEGRRCQPELDDVTDKEK